MAKQQTPSKKPKNAPPPDDDETDGEGNDEGDEDEEDDDRKINAIVTNRVNRALKPLQKMIGDLTSKLDSLSKPKEPEGDSEDEEEETPAPSKKGKSGAESKKLTALEKRVKDAEERAAQAEKAQQEQAAKAKIQEENAVIAAALQKAGVTDPKVVKAITLSLREDEMIVRDEETGKPRFKGVDKYGQEDLVDPEAGIGKWLKADGKAFLPAVPAGGSGAGGRDASSVARPGATKANVSQMSAREKAAIELERASMGLPPLGQD